MFLSSQIWILIPFPRHAREQNLQGKVCRGGGEVVEKSYRQAGRWQCWVREAGGGRQAGAGNSQAAASLCGDVFFSFFLSGA